MASLVDIPSVVKGLFPIAAPFHSSQQSSHQSSGQQSASNEHANVLHPSSSSLSLSSMASNNSIASNRVIGSPSSSMFPSLPNLAPTSMTAGNVASNLPVAVAWTNNTLLLMESETGHVIYTFTLPSTLSKSTSSHRLEQLEIVACEYIISASCFLLATNDSSIIRVPYPPDSQACNLSTSSSSSSISSSRNSAPLEIVQWPVQPLYIVNIGQNVCVVAEDGCACVFRIPDKATSLPIPTQPSSVNKTQISTKGCVPFVCGNDKHLTLVFPPSATPTTASTSSSTSSSSSTVHSVATICTWQFSGSQSPLPSTLSPGRCHWLPVAQQSRTTFQLEGSESICSVGSHTHSHAFSLLISSANSKDEGDAAKKSKGGDGKRSKVSSTGISDQTKHDAASMTAGNKGRWVKLSLNGETLITRPLSDVPKRILVSSTPPSLESLATISSPETFWISTGAGVMEFDTRYGLCLNQITNTAVGLPGSCSLVLPARSSPIMDTANHSHILIVSIKGKEGSSSSITRKTISSRNGDDEMSNDGKSNGNGKPSVGTLCSLLGALSSTTTAKASTASTSSTLSSTVNLVNSLPRAAKRKLQDASLKLRSSLRDEEMELSNQSGVSNGATGDEETKTKKKKLEIDVPTKAAADFLASLENLGIPSFSSSSSTSSSSNTSKKSTPATTSNPPFLLPSDWDAVNVLLHSQTMSLYHNPSLPLQAFVCGRWDVLYNIARYCPDLDEELAVKLILMSMQASSKSLENVRVTGSGRIEWKGGKKNEIEGGDQQGTSNVENSLKSPTASKKKGKASKNATPLPSSLNAPSSSSSSSSSTTPLLLVQSMCMGLWSRTSSFNALLVSDVVKSLSSQCASVLLRIFIGFLDDSNFYFRVNDQHTKRVVIWCQALIDAHFTTLSLSLLTNSVSRGAVVGAVKICEDAEQAIDDCEAALGAWTHITRSSKSVGGGSAHPLGLYQLETLSF